MTIAARTIPSWVGASEGKRRHLAFCLTLTEWKRNESDAAVPTSGRSSVLALPPHQGREGLDWIPLRPPFTALTPSQVWSGENSPVSATACDAPV